MDSLNRQQLSHEGWQEPEVGISSGHREKRPNEKETEPRGQERLERVGVTTRGEGPPELGVQEEEWVCGPLGLLGSQESTYKYTRQYYRKCWK